MLNEADLTKAPALGRPLRVLAATTWGTPCGIANYAEMLMEGLTAAGSDTLVVPVPSLLNPDLLQASLHGLANPPDVLWLNYHAGLHSRWTPEAVEAAMAATGLPIVVTYHDTYDGYEAKNSPSAIALSQRVAAFIVHEPTVDLPGAHYLRQGVPPPQIAWEIGTDELAYFGQPVLGTVGFDFPWKNYQRLAEVTAELGWAFMVLSNNMTEAKEQELRKANPWLLCHRGFLTTARIVSLLRGCTATAFMYECFNTGTSGAIRLGIAALKPIYVLAGCRQFRDLYAEYQELSWVRGWPQLADAMRGSFPVTVDYQCVEILANDSWQRQAVRYDEIFHHVVPAAPQAGGR